MVAAADYYATGNKDLATETALTVQRLEPVREQSCALNLFLCDNKIEGIDFDGITEYQIFIFPITLH